MAPIKVDSGVYWIGMNDRTTDLFEGLWPVGREGVSYNTYLIADKSNAIIDLAPAAKAQEFLDQISQLTDVSQVEYLIMHHMEPDHTGALNILLQRAPNITILCSRKMKDMLATFYKVTQNVRSVEDGETISLGETSLTFVLAPLLHWPETMVTYDSGRQILFSCDAFGGYGALRGAVFDDTCTCMEVYEREALRYYANIVAKYSRMVLKAIVKLGDTPVKIIAPSHGLIWRENPGRILELYVKWANYAQGPAEPEVTLIYGSMYGFTEMMMNAVAHGIADAGVPLAVFDAARTHVSYILPSLWTKTGVMIGAPTYEGEMFPPVAQVLQMAVMKRVLNRKVARFGSYGWAGGAQRHMERIIEPIKWELTDVFEFTGKPTAEDLNKGEQFGAQFAEAVKSA